MNIYQINQAIMDLVDPETGEILDWEAFDALQMAREDKIENVACWYKNLTAEAAAIRQEELNLQKRRKAVEKLAETREKWLEKHLDGQKFETARCAITFRKTTKVELEDEAAVINWAQRNARDDILKYTDPTVNKAELAKVLKAEVDVPGAALVTGLSMGVK